MGSNVTHRIAAIACILIVSVLCQSEEDQETEKKMRIQRQQQTIKDQIGLVYGNNTEIITFNVVQMTDFIVKTPEVEEIKATVYAYWKQENAYISSEYREGEHIRLLVYEDNYRILSDNKFYTTYGFKFNAEKDKVYTIRLVQNGKIHKLVSMELSKTIAMTENRANKQNINEFSGRMSSVAVELGMLSQISEFAFVFQEKAARTMNHSVCIYMTYLIIEAIVILLIVAFQIKVLIKLLGSPSLV